MATDSLPENITTLHAGVPTLDALAKRIRTGLSSVHRSRAAWLDTTLQLAADLREARSRFIDNEQFGQWLGDNKLQTLSKDDRAALIGIGQHPALAREIFTESEDRWSWRTCWSEIKVRDMLDRHAPAKPQAVSFAVSSQPAKTTYDTAPLRISSPGSPQPAKTTAEIVALDTATGTCRPYAPPGTREPFHRHQPADQGSLIINSISALINALDMTPKEAAEAYTAAARRFGAYPSAADIRELAQALNLLASRL
jgi:hypothetical protein